jgi:hypothetical protein
MHETSHDSESERIIDFHSKAARPRMRGGDEHPVLVEALEKGLGDHSAATNGLERFGGDSDFGPEWDSRMEELGTVNPADWK